MISLLNLNWAVNVLEHKVYIANGFAYLLLHTLVSLILSFQCDLAPMSIAVEVVVQMLFVRLLEGIIIITIVLLSGVLDLAIVVCSCIWLGYIWQLYSCCFSVFVPSNYLIILCFSVLFSLRLKTGLKRSFTSFEKRVTYFRISRKAVSHCFSYTYMWNNFKLLSTINHWFLDGYSRWCWFCSGTLLLFEICQKKYIVVYDNDLKTKRECLWWTQCTHVNPGNNIIERWNGIWEEESLTHVIQLANDELSWDKYTLLIRYENIGSSF